MSLARLVITAVTVEGRSKSAVARDYGVSRFWVQNLVNRFEAEGEAAFEPHSRRPHTNPRAVSLEVEDQIIRLRKTLTKKGLDAGAETIAAHLADAGVVAGAGGLDDLADPVPARVRHRRSRRNGPGRRGSGSAPTSPTNAGRPTSPTGASPTAPRWRSSTSSTTTPGSASPRPPGGSSPAPRCGSLPRRVRAAGASRRGADRQRGRLHRQTTRSGPGRARGRARAARHPAQPLPALPSADLRQGRTVPPNPEEMAGRPTPRRHPRRAATPAEPVPHATTTPSGRTGRCDRRTPAQAYAARPKAIPTGPIIPAHYRVRHDKIDRCGAVTLRHNSRLHHIGLGARLAGTPVTLLIDDLHIRVIHRHTGELIRELTLDPSRDYQPRGLPPGPPKRTAATPRPASRSRPNRATAAGVKAGRRPPEGPRP